MQCSHEEGCSCRRSRVPRPSRRRVLLAVVIASACASPQGPISSASPDPVHPGILADLCAAQNASEDPATSRAAFARAHGPLHDLARDVQSRDRQAAARLLEDKQRVESVLERTSGQTELATSLADLIESTRHALEAVGSPAPPCGSS